jgi:hypothetical protein
MEFVQRLWIYSQASAWERIKGKMYGYLMNPKIALQSTLTYFKYSSYMRSLKWNYNTVVMDSCSCVCFISVTAVAFVSNLVFGTSRKCFQYSVHGVQTNWFKFLFFLYRIWWMMHKNVSCFEIVFENFNFNTKIKSKLQIIPESLLKIVHWCMS